MKRTYLLVTAAALLWSAHAVRAEEPRDAVAPGRASPDRVAEIKPAPTGGSAATSNPLVDPNAPVVLLEANAVVVTHDLGGVRAGSEHFVVFLIENARDANIAIRRIRPDCECISAVQPPDHLLARGTTRVTARFVPPPIRDVYGSELLVTTEDPRRKTLRLRILCRVAP